MPVVAQLFVVTLSADRQTVDFADTVQSSSLLVERLSALFCHFLLAGANGTIIEQWKT